MKLSTILKALPAALLLLCLFAPAAVAARHDDDDHDHDHDHDGRQLFVDDDKAQCPHAQFTSIQTAVTAAMPGDTVNVCPGTYPEQVVIRKSLTVRGISVANQNLALIRPPQALPNSTSTFDGSPVAAIVLVDGAKSVTLFNLTVDGASNGINGCAPEFAGVYYRNSSGTAESLAVRNIKLGPGLGGCQSGIGIFVQSGLGRKSQVNILNNSIHDYQKNGIAANEAGTFVNVRGNALTGLGPTNEIAQNGIQVAFGAAGFIDSNSVIDHVYGLCVSLDVCPTFATNILVVESDGVKVTRNNTGNSQVNIDYEGNKGEVSDNTVFTSRVFDGVALIGNSNRAAGNTIFNSGESGVYVDGNKNEVTGNTINEAPVGVLQQASNSGNKIGDNRFFNTGFNVLRAPAAPFSALAPLGTQGRSAQPARP